MNNSMLAHCGIDCSECEAYLATINNNDQLRTKTAQEWSKLYGVTMKAQDINCMGCQSEGPYLSHCNDCKIRSCSSGKGYSNCGKCPDFSCDTVENILKHVPGAKERLTNKA